MDAEMKAEEITSGDSSWDLRVEDGIVPIISGESESVQTATLAAFLGLGTVPQIEGAGVDWAGFLTGEKSFGEINVEVLESLRKAGKSEYLPSYKIDGDRLVLTVEKTEGA